MDLSVHVKRHNNSSNENFNEYEVDYQQVERPNSPKLRPATSTQEHEDAGKQDPDGQERSKSNDRHPARPVNNFPMVAFILE